MFKPLPDIINVEATEAKKAEKQSPAEAERARMIAIKQALLQTAATPGYQYIKQMAANILAKTTANAINAKREERDDEIAKARAAKEIFQELFSVIETTLTFGTEQEPSWFSDLDTLMSEVTAEEK